MMSRCVECQDEKWCEIFVRVLLRGHQQLIPRQAPGMTPMPGRAAITQPQPNRFPHFVFPWTGPVAGSTIRRHCVTASQRKTSGAAVVCHQSYANFQGKAGRFARHTLLQNAFQFWSTHPHVYGTLTVHNHFYHLGLSASTPSLLYHAIFAMRLPGHVLTTNFRASSKSNRPIPNAMGRK